MDYNYFYIFLLLLLSQIKGLFTRPCQSIKECGIDQCCIFVSSAFGYCVQKPSLDEPCDPHSGCPCSKPYQCEFSGQKHKSFGTMYICESISLRYKSSDNHDDHDPHIDTVLSKNAVFLASRAGRPNTLIKSQHDSSVLNDVQAKSDNEFSLGFKRRPKFGKHEQSESRTRKYRNANDNNYVLDDDDPGSHYDDRLNIRYYEIPSSESDDLDMETMKSKLESDNMPYYKYLDPVHEDKELDNIVSRNEFEDVDNIPRSKTSKSSSDDNDNIKSRIGNSNSVEDELLPVPKIKTTYVDPTFFGNEVKTKYDDSVHVKIPLYIKTSYEHKASDSTAKENDLGNNDQYTADDVDDDPTGEDRDDDDKLKKTLKVQYTKPLKMAIKDDSRDDDGDSDVIENDPADISSNSKNNASANDINNKSTDSKVIRPPQKDEKGEIDDIAQDSNESHLRIMKKLSNENNFDVHRRSNRRAKYNPLSFIVKLSDYTNKIESDPIFHKIESDPVLNKIESDPVLNKIESDPVLNKIESDPDLKKIDSDPALNNIEYDPIFNKIEYDPVLNKIESDPVLNKIESDPDLKKIDSDPALNNIEYDPDLNEIESDPVLNKIESDPVLNKIESDPALNKNESDPALNKNESDPALNKIESDPVLNRNGNSFFFGSLKSDELKDDPYMRRRKVRSLIDKEDQYTLDSKRSINQGISFNPNFEKLDNQLQKLPSYWKSVKEQHRSKHSHNDLQKSRILPFISTLVKSPKE